MEGGKRFGLEWEGQGELPDLPCFTETLQANPGRRPCQMTENQAP